MVCFKNNSARLKREYDQLREKNPALYDLLTDLESVMECHFDRDLTITMIFRTQLEQDSIYTGKKNSKGILYDNKPWKSPHQLWHAVDIRSRDFSSEQITWLVNYLNKEHGSDNAYKPTAMCHNVGLGDHFHIQLALA